jgi:hypothetical protein
MLCTFADELVGGLLAKDCTHDCLDDPGALRVGAERASGDVWADGHASIVLYNICWPILSSSEVIGTGLRG